MIAMERFSRPQLSFLCLLCSAFLTGCTDGTHAYAGWLLGDASSMSGSSLSSTGSSISSQQEIRESSSSSSEISLPTPPKQKPTWRMPILMYHYISDPNATKDELGRNLTVSPESLDRQLTQAEQAGYQIATFSDLINGTLSPKSVMFTFDDGHADNYWNAMPVLLKHHARGVFFIIPGHFGDSDSVTPEEVKEMSRNGMEICAHTMHHPELNTLSVVEQRKEIVDSIDALGTLLGIPIPCFAYPYGKYDSDSVRILLDKGVRYAVTTHGGTATSLDHSLLFPRFSMRDETSVRGILNAVERAEMEEDNPTSSAESSTDSESGSTHLE